MATPMTGDEFPWADLPAGGELQNSIWSAPGKMTRPLARLQCRAVNAGYAAPVAFLPAAMTGSSRASNSASKFPTA